MRLEARTRRVAPGVQIYPVGMKPDGSAVAFVERAIDELDRKLADRIPPDGGRAVEWIAEQAVSSFKAREKGASRQSVYDGFLIALPGRSDPAAREAVRRILRDEAPEEYSRTFAPTPGDLARLTGLIEAEWRLERDRLAWLLSLPEEHPALPEPQPTPEEMASVRERARRLVAGAAASRDLERARPAGADHRAGAAQRVAEDLARRKAVRSGEDDAETV